MTRWNVRCGKINLPLTRISADEIVLGPELFKILSSPHRDGLLRVNVEGKSYDILIERTGGAAYLAYINHYVLEVTLEDQLLREIDASQKQSALTSGQTPIYAPMPGLVVSVDVELGERVTPGTRLIVLEAMKMENQIRAITPGTVKEIRVRAGETVEKGQILLLLESNNTCE